MADRVAGLQKAIKLTAQQDNLFEIAVTAPSGKLAELITSQYGSTDELVKKLIAESINHFSNGWGWLVLDGDALKVTSLHDADTP
ncbi:hypothetical protein GY659_23975, partial [Escherichia coli]|nr:hypothetical protein [Escherichia coli]